MEKFGRLLSQFDILLPMVTHWVEEQERMIEQEGVPLSMDQQLDAYEIGIKQIDRVRLMKVERIPLPTHPVLKAGLKLTNLISPHTVGISFRYGIYIRSDCWNQRRLVVHEMTHTMQYERFGGIEEFLRAYLHECLTTGYPYGPLEQEAVAMEQKICW
ncbi:MAG: hypothetical protein AAF587_26275 [Bacteroidota bacterium]